MPKSKSLFDLLEEGKIIAFDKQKKCLVVNHISSYNIYCEENGKFTLVKKCNNSFIFPSIKDKRNFASSLIEQFAQ